MKKLSEKTIEILAKTFLVIMGFFELSSVLTLCAFHLIFDISDKQIERSSNLMGYFMITALFFFILYDSVGTYYILVYEKKEEKEKKIKMKPYVEKLKYDSFKEIYNLFKDKLVNEGYKEKLINITTSTKVYIFEKTKFLNRDYIVLVDTKKYSKVQLYLISEELEKYNNDLKSEYQTYTRVIFITEIRQKK